MPPADLFASGLVVILNMEWLVLSVFLFWIDLPQYATAVAADTASAIHFQEAVAADPPWSCLASISASQIFPRLEK